jgi:hypothetical protein
MKTSKTPAKAGARIEALVAAWPAVADSIDVFAEDKIDLLT